MDNTDLPLLTYVSDKYNDVDLKNVLLISCQHLLSTTFSMYQKLFERGLKPANTFLIGKCYSTNEEVYQWFKDAGVNISEYSKAYTSHQSFDEQFQTYIALFIQEIKEQVDFGSYEKIVVLDDGGELLTYANDFLDIYHNVVGIEQTTSGYNKLKDIDLNFPVVNVARSHAKLETEGQMIAELVVERVLKYFEAHHISDPKILVVGQGAVGEKVTSLLKKDFNVSGCDSDTNKCDFSGNYKNHLPDFDVIIGVTGVPSLVQGDFSKLKDGVHLISASSSDREFSSVYLRRLEEENTECHKDYAVEGIHLANSGFPINFDGGMHSLAPEKIQLTRALLLTGVFQAVKEREKGLIELSEEVQNELLEVQ